jgi:Tfp pilus assembly protein PilV
MSVSSFQKKGGKGFGIVEVVVASAIISLSIFSLYTVFIVANRLNEMSGNSTVASFLAEEGLEAMRHMRDGAWSAHVGALTPGTDYYLSFSTTTSLWTVNSITPEIIDGKFFRKVIVEDVYRDASQDIILTGGTLDTGTKEIIAEVSWLERNATSTVLIGTYLHDIFSN